MVYEEGIYVGYRYFDKEKIEPLFPFGYGLSYTQFEYIELVTDKSEMSEGDIMSLKIKIKNAGTYSGGEIIQVYAHQKESNISRPPQELVGFAKVHLKPGQVEQAEIRINANDLAYYNFKQHEWILEPGEYELSIGTSSHDIKMTSSLIIN